jgi:hypothetical protein
MHCDDDIFAMKKLVAAVALLSIAICLPGAQAAHAQDLSVPPPNLLPPPPPPPPPPRMDIPKVPKMGEVPTRQRTARPRGESYGDKVIQCIHEGSAAGLGPNERAAYSRVCADSR